MSKDTTICSTRRLTSPFLSNIPWHTSVITEHDELANGEGGGIDSFKGFFKHLLQYESRLFTLAPSMMDMQGMLGLGVAPQENQIVPRTPKVGVREWPRVCGLVCAYRLADVVALLGGCEPNKSQVPSMPLPEKELYGMSKLEHWHTLLTDFNMLMQKIEVPAQNPFPNDSTSPTFRLLSLISKNEWRKSFANIEGNFLIAAMHVSAMKEFPFSQDSYPDIPDRFESIVDLATGGKHLSLSSEEREDLHDIYQLTRNIASKLSGTKDGLPFLRAPLQLSLLISPLFLLIPVQLHKKTLSRQLMLAINACLGNQKPEALVAVEKEIWKVVFALADGHRNPTELLKTLADYLPWDKISHLTADEIGWFGIRTKQLVSKSVAMPQAMPAVESRQIDEDELAVTPICALPPHRVIIDEAMMSAYTLLSSKRADKLKRRLVSNTGHSDSQDEGLSSPMLETPTLSAQPQSPVTVRSDIEHEPVMNPVSNTGVSRGEGLTVADPKLDASKIHSVPPPGLTDNRCGPGGMDVDRGSQDDDGMSDLQSASQALTLGPLDTPTASKAALPTLGKAYPDLVSALNAVYSTGSPDTQATSPAPTIPDFRESTCAEQTSKTSTQSVDLRKEITGRSVIGNETTAHAGSPPVPQGEDGIDPSLVFHEGWAYAHDAVNDNFSHQAGVPMEEDDDPSLVISMEDMEVPRESSVGPEEDEAEEIPRASSEPAEDDGEDMEVQSSDLSELEDDEEGMQGKTCVDSEDVEMEGQASVVPDEDVPLGEGRDQMMELNPEQLAFARRMTPAFVEETLQEVIVDMVHDRFLANQPSSSSSSKRHLRSREMAPHYQENRPALAKKRKVRSGSGSDPDTEEGHPFAASLARTLRANRNREPETVKEFTEIEEISFTQDHIPAKVVCDKELEAVDADGNRHTFHPQAHYIDYIDRLKQFFQRVEDGYVDGHPLHIADPDRSGFAIVTAETFSKMPAQDVQALIRCKNVVVTGCKYPELKFDEAGLRTLAPLDSQVSFLDFTFPSTTKDKNTTPATVSGLVSDILENARNPEGKILNAIDFPACFPTWDDSKGCSSYATDVVAWDYLRGKPYCGNFTNPYPTAHMRWGLAGTANALTFKHIDSDGLATFVRVITGTKVWGTLQESQEHQLSSIDFFLDEKFRLDEIDERSTFGLEVIVLRPGDTLFMRPGVPHFVFGPEDTICYGGHFYATALMQDTLRSLIHSFVVGDFVTNITHYPSRALLRRTVLLYHIGLVEDRFQPPDVEYAHVPDITTFEGVLDLLSACTLAILGNVFDFRTYCAPNQTEDERMTITQSTMMLLYDRNDIPQNERMAICYVRGVALFLFDWVRTQLQITGPDGDVMKDLPSRFLVQIGKTVVNYKGKAMRMKMKGAPHCDTSSLRRQLANVVKCDSAIEKLWKCNAGISDDRLEIEGKDGYVVQKKSGPINQPLNPTQLLQRGMSPFDITFFEGQASGFDMADEAVKTAEERTA